MHPCTAGQTLSSIEEIIGLSPCKAGVCFCRVWSSHLVDWRCHVTTWPAPGALPALHCAHHMPAAGLVPVQHRSHMHTQSLAPAAQSLASSSEAQAELSNVKGALQDMPAVSQCSAICRERAASAACSCSR